MSKIIEAYACDINQNKIAELSDFDNMILINILKKVHL